VNLKIRCISENSPRKVQAKTSPALTQKTHVSLKFLEIQRFHFRPQASKFYYMKALSHSFYATFFQNFFHERFLKPVFVFRF